LVLGFLFSSPSSFFFFLPPHICTLHLLPPLSPQQPTPNTLFCRATSHEPVLPVSLSLSWTYLPATSYQPAGNISQFHAKQLIITMSEHQLRKPKANWGRGFGLGL
jgi:hypothetical protein